MRSALLPPLGIAALTVLSAVCCCELSVQRANCETPAASAASVRTFDFHYAAKLRELPADANVRVWIPVPRSSAHQQVRQTVSRLPGKPSIAAEPKYGNKILYFTSGGTESGSLDFSTSYRITRREVRSFDERGEVEIPAAQRQRFLKPNAKVPITGKPLTLLDGIDLSLSPRELGKALYRRVDDHMRYDKSKPGFGRGDAAWACDSRFGNCTDFHSLFISLARSQKLPARFEIGFALPVERGQGTVGGYHCWAHFHVQGQGWMPVDISEADKHPQLKQYYFGNLSENRVAFSMGRDINLVPRQASEPLNYFIYPHVEVDGQVWPQDKIELKFSFKDDLGQHR